MVDLEKRDKHFSEHQWPKPIIKLLLGRISPDKLMAAASHAYKQEEQIRLCQSHFYIGMMSLFANDLQSARSHFSKSAATRAPVCFESTAAVTELERLGKIQQAI